MDASGQTLFTHLGPSPDAVFDRQLEIMQPELGSLFAAGIYERDLTVEDIDMVHVEGRDLVQELVQIDDLVRLRWPLLLS